MDFVIVFLLIILIVLILVLWFSLLNKMDRLGREIGRVREELKSRAEDVRVGAGRAEPVKPIPGPPVGVPPQAAAVRAMPEPRETEPFRPVSRPVQSGPAPAGPGRREVPNVEKVAERADVRAAEQPTDWEKFIGENLISK